jgi:hypothetical protein
LPNLLSQKSKYSRPEPWKLAQGSEHYPKEIARVELLGSSGPLAFSRGTAGLVVALPGTKPNDYAYALRIISKKP